MWERLIVKNLMNRFILSSCANNIGLDWKTDKHALIEIRYLLCEVFGDTEKRILVLEAADSNFIIIKCYTPWNKVNIVVMEAQMNLDVLKRSGVVTLRKGYHTLWNTRNIWKREKWLLEKEV